MPRSGGLRISGRTRLGIPAQHQSVIFKDYGGESVQPKLIPQVSTFRRAGKTRKRCLQAQNDLVRTTGRSDKKRNWRGIGGRDDPDLRSKVRLMVQHQVE